MAAREPEKKEPAITREGTADLLLSQPMSDGVNLGGKGETESKSRGAQGEALIDRKWFLHL